LVDCLPEQLHDQSYLPLHLLVLHIDVYEMDGLGQRDFEADFAQLREDLTDLEVCVLDAWKVSECHVRA